MVGKAFVLVGYCFSNFSSASVTLASLGDASSAMSWSSVAAITADPAVNSASTSAPIKLHLHTLFLSPSSMLLGLRLLEPTRARGHSATPSPAARQHSNHVVC